MREIHDLSLLHVERSEIHSMGSVDSKFVGMGIGSGFANTKELHGLKYDEAMSSGDKQKWLRAMDQKHERMMHHKVFVPVRKDCLPPGTKFIDSTWAMKKKANGTYRAQAATRGTLQSRQHIVSSCF
jgi:hypothetical protein